MRLEDKITVSAHIEQLNSAIARVVNTETGATYHDNKLEFTK